MELITKDIKVTSLQIAEYAGRTHSNILRLIKKEFSKIQMDLATFRNTYTDDQGKERSMFVLPKKELLFIVSKFDANLRWQILNRLEEIENKASVNIPQELIDRFMPKGGFLEENKKGLLKTQLVRAHYRADMSKEENRLMQRLHELQKRVDGLFKDEMLMEIEDVKRELAEVKALATSASHIP